MAEFCIHCGTFNAEGYCWGSPDGAHLIEDDPEQVYPWDCCSECGLVLPSEVLNGIAPHHCDPERVAAFQAWLVDLDDKTEWDYRR